LGFGVVLAAAAGFGLLGASLGCPPAVGVVVSVEAAAGESAEGGPPEDELVFDTTLALGSRGDAAGV